MDGETIKIILSCFCGSAFMGFLQFLIQRKDSKDEWKSEMVESFKELEAKVMKLDLKIDSNKEAMAKQLNDIRDENQQQNAIQARIRLLRFADEIRLEQLHSKDSYNQALQDANVYEKYCSDHPKFKKNHAVSSIDIIRKTFERRMEKNDFL